MKNLLIIGTLLLSMNSSAGNEKGNGGDICENKMRNISNDIKSWLLKDEYKGLQLPEDLEEESYKHGMLKAIKKSLLSCTTDKVFIGKAEKTCINFQDDNGDTRVKCNFDRFMKTAEDKEYQLMHHEFAGVAGFETNNGEEKSDYKISIQINKFLKKEEVLKLGIKKNKAINMVLYGMSLEASALVVEDFKSEGVNARRLNPRECTQASTGTGNFCVVASSADKTFVLYGMSLEASALMIEDIKSEGIEARRLSSSECGQASTSRGNFCVVVD